MPTNLQSRTQYLTLAEFCQAVIEGLMDFEEGVVASKSGLKPKLREALQSLQAISDGNLHALARTDAHPFGTFEQVRTLQEVWSNSEQKEAVELLSGLLATSAPASKQRRAAKELIGLFSRLQTKALWNFRQRRQALPKSFRELCRAL